MILRASEGVCAEQETAVQPFRDNVEFLEAKSQEAMLLLERAALFRKLNLSGSGREGAGVSRSLTDHARQQVLFDSGSQPDPPMPASLEEVNLHLSELRNQTRKRLELSSPDEIPFLSTVRQFKLDPTSQDVIWLLFFHATSTDFRQKFGADESGSSHRNSDRSIFVGDMLGILFPGDFQQQLAAREIFSADKPLLGRHLNCGGRSKSAARGGVKTQRPARRLISL